ncbi:shikimate kinase [Pusillimonas sp.]|uniref:shikimate kinase n=1 Tax=Pusillimonas sp. TaxID=3040095 RepID=UPI0039B91955
MNDSLRADAAVPADVSCDEQALAAPAGAGGKPIFLVGMMGAGKTTIGRHLAKALNREFVDLDLALEARCGVPVAVIFEIEGEEGFRRRESQLLDLYSQREGIVLATGGGAVLAEQNRCMLKERGLVIYLRATSDELYQRVARDRQRPLLQTDDPRARVAELLAQRAPLYEEVATLAFDTGSTPIPQAVHDLVTLLEQHEHAR